MFQESGPLQPKQEQEVKVPERVFTPEELRDRYEAPYRDNMAERFKKEKALIREKRDAKLAQVLQGSFSSKEFVTHESELAQAEIDKSISSLNKNYEEVRASTLVTESEISERPLFKKIWYKIVTDPKRSLLTDKQQQISKTQEEIVAKEQEKEALRQRLVHDLARKQQELDRMLSQVKESSGKDIQVLREEVHEVNQNSRQAITKTLEKLKSGALDISVLAQEANAIVVHSLPLEGWGVNNTMANNREIDVLALSPDEKIATVTDKQPDVSASIITAGEKIEGQSAMYPFGVIIDGKVIASYEKDSGTETRGDARIKHPEFGSKSNTLLPNTDEAFRKTAQQRTPDNYPWNESIVHKPVIKGIFIDEDRLLHDESRGDDLRYKVPVDQEQEIVEKFGQDVIIGRGVPTKGSFEGKEVIAINRRRNGLEKALDYARDKYPQLPVYLQKKDGLYNQSGEKVSAQDIYA